MGLLSRLTTWIADLFGGTEADEATADDRPTDEAKDGEGDEDDEDDENGALDPAAVTETRTAATDDAVDALRDVRRSQETAATTDDGVDSDSNSAPDSTSDPDTATDRDRS